MTENKTQLVSSMTNRQKIIAAVLAIILVFIIWQVLALFRTSANNPSATLATNGPMPTTTAGGGASQQTPKHVPVPPKPAPMTPRELALMNLQKETQEKYINALNELQMLKLSRDIAETNQAITNAKLATVVNEKKIVDLLSPPPPPSNSAAYAKNLVAPAASITNIAQPTQEAQYTVVSVSELQHRWSAVLGYQGSLYNVHTGDILPTDGSRVISIDKEGLILEKNNVKRKISLVPII